MDDDVIAARDGDRAALGRLLARLGPRMRRIVGHRTGGLVRQGIAPVLGVSDLIQSGYVRLIRNLRTFRGTTDAEFDCWAARIVSNRVQGRRRYQRATKRVDVGGRYAHEAASRFDDDTPSSQVRRGEELSRARAAMARLPADQARVIRLRVVECKSHADIAAEMGRSEVAVRSLLSRARATLAVEVERASRGG